MGMYWYYCIICLAVLQSQRPSLNITDTLALLIIICRYNNMLLCLVCYMFLTYKTDESWRYNRPTSVSRQLSFTICALFVRHNVFLYFQLAEYEHYLLVYRTIRIVCITYYVKFRKCLLLLLYVSTFYNGCKTRNCSEVIKQHTNYDVYAFGIKWGAIK